MRERRGRVLCFCRFGWNCGLGEQRWRKLNCRSKQNERRREHYCRNLSLQGAVRDGTGNEHSAHLQNAPMRHRPFVSIFYDVGVTSSAGMRTPGKNHGNSCAVFTRNYRSGMRSNQVFPSRERQSPDWRALKTPIGRLAFPGVPANSPARMARSAPSRLADVGGLGDGAFCSRRYGTCPQN